MSPSVFPGMSPKVPPYANADPRHAPHGWRAVFRWAVWDRLLGRRRPAPPGPPAPRVPPDPKAIHEVNGPPRVTWIGHASFLGSWAGKAFLVDPVFSSRLGGFYPRYVPPGLGISDLPPLEVVMVSHSHYDHLDAATWRQLPPDVPCAVPLGLGRWFRRRGRTNVVELDWWQSAEFGPLRVTAVPARHWSRRTPWDTNHSWWCGFVVEADGTRIYHAGDSAWFDGFAEIGRRFPDIDAALLPIGAYEPGWFMEHNHLTPEQAGEAFLATGARMLIPMHWGTFQLTDEPLSEPIERLHRWWNERQPEGRELRVLAVGETGILS